MCILLLGVESFLGFYLLGHKSKYEFLEKSLLFNMHFYYIISQASKL
jgi:hypothetical protein